MSGLPTRGASEQDPAAVNLMRGLIDYAGLFPPSELPMGEAIEAYAKYRVSRDGWMLSRFIVPARRLAELDEYTDSLFGERPPFRFSVVVAAGSELDKYMSGFRDALARILEFEQHHGARVKVEMIETSLPVNPEAPINPETYVALFESMERAVRDDLGHDLDIFVEVPWKVQYEDSFKSTFDDLADHVIEALALYNNQPRNERLTMGVKLRCGGVKPEQVPDPEIVTTVLSHAVRRGVPFKATAGLHHPVRHHRDEFGGMMHGFLNVFGAGLLAREHRLNRDQIGQIVGEEDPAAFEVKGERFAWRDLECAVPQLSAGRRDQFISFGSCSFDEPREDLAKLGILR